MHDSFAAISINFKTTSFCFQIKNFSFDAVMKMVTVKYHGNEVPYLNELEYVHGEVWANVYLVRCLLSPLVGISYYPVFKCMTL
jgi:hypothetical protein